MAGQRAHLHLEREGRGRREGCERKEVLCPPHVDCAEARNKFSATVLMIIDAVLDLSNERKDVGFTSFSEMQEKKEPTMQHND